MAELVEIRSGSKASALGLTLDLRGGNVRDIGFMPSKLLNFRVVNVKPGGEESRPGKQQRKRQPHITEADHTHLRGFLSELCPKLRG